MQKCVRGNASFEFQAMFFPIIVGGAILAVYQFFLNRSLWLDEASLALNIINRDFAGLARALDYNQVAPIGFLFVEKLLVMAFGENELALRLFPLVCFLASIPFFYLFSEKLVENHVIALMATAIFSIAWSILRYSSEVKQYSTDVLFAIVIVYYLLHLKVLNNRSLVIFAVFGGIALWFSNTAIIMLFISGVYLMYFELLRKKSFKILSILMLWAASFSIYYFFFIHNHPTRAFMATYWGNSFLPLNPFATKFYIFLFSSTKDIYAYLLGFGPFWFIPATISLSAIGFLLYQKKYIVIYFCLAPMFITLFLSAFHLYPFSRRLLLFILPQIIIIYSIGLYNLFQLIKSKLPILPVVLLILPVIIMFYPLYLQFTRDFDEVKDSLEYMEKNIQKDESIYIYYGSNRAFEFYEKTGAVKILNPIVEGSCHRDENFKYDQELLNLKG
ncbi:MAG: glycosyltransferase family 39 protein [Desulfatibacillum sp.]|nr:glycosyltransferase family 39 protein [Desulfatibacillum sp.]